MGIHQWLTALRRQMRARLEDEGEVEGVHDKQDDTEQVASQDLLVYAQRKDAREDGRKRSLFNGCEGIGEPVEEARASRRGDVINHQLKRD